MSAPVGVDSAQFVETERRPVGVEAARAEMADASPQECVSPFLGIQSRLPYPLVMEISQPQRIIAANSAPPKRASLNHGYRARVTGVLVCLRWSGIEIMEEAHRANETSTETFLLLPFDTAWPPCLQRGQESLYHVGFNAPA
jgi:hypothetical protein